MTIQELIQALNGQLSFESRYDQDNEEWVLDVDMGGGRRQDISLYEIEESGHRLLRLVTGIGSAEEFGAQRLTSAMEMNASLVYGALAIYQGNLVMTAAVDPELGVEHLAEIIKYMTRIADLYEKMLFGHDRA